MNALVCMHSVKPKRRLIRFNPAVATVSILFLQLLVGPTGAEAQTPIQAGVALFEAGRLEEAQQFFEDRIRVSPGDADAHYYLGRARLARGRFRGAEKAFREARLLDDSKYEYHLWLINTYEQEWESAGVVRKLSLSRAWREACESALERLPSAVEIRRRLFSFYLNTPGLYGGSREKAMEQADRIRELDRTAWHLVLAEMYLRDERADLAEREYLEALAVDSLNTELNYEIGFFYQEEERYQDAFARFEAAVEADPENFQALYQIGRTAVFSGMNLERGIACMRRYLTIEPEEGWPRLSAAHYRLGMLYEMKGDLASAISEYQAALSLDPNHEDARAALRRLRGPASGRP